LEDEFNLGNDLWPTCVERVLGVLSRAHPDAPFSLTVSGSDVQVDRMASSPEIDPDEIDGLTTYGNVATMWGAISNNRTQLSDISLEGIRTEANLAWWVSHGYKEPFLIGDSLSSLVGEDHAFVVNDATIRVEQTADLFVPHRIRMHKRFGR
jgi:hypothetical protein